MKGILLRAADALRDRIRRRRWTHDQAAGRRGEDLAHRLLRKKGFTVVARNYRPRSGHGEIDLVAWDGGTLVFVEVKLRATQEYGSPEEAVDREKRRRLERAGREYARQAGVLWENVRFDIVAITAGERPAIEHFSNAFRAGPTV
ncbi:MAG: YraN family protein [Bryobacterales bacterium]|nr:YraN family protein [Bryobacterales bacterium]